MAGRVLRICIERGCPNYTRAKRCGPHERAHQAVRGSSHQRGLGADHRARRAAAISAEPWCHRVNLKGAGFDGPCPHWDAGTPANPLTGHHLLARARGGQSGPLVVLCLRCNDEAGTKQLAWVGGGGPHGHRMDDGRRGIL